MLNELKEYEQYSTAIEQISEFRLSYLCLSNKLAGLERALTIVAQKFLFGIDDFCNSKKKIDTRILITKYALSLWLFGKKDEVPVELKNIRIKNPQLNTELEKIMCWFPKYIISMAINKLNDIADIVSVDSIDGKLKEAREELNITEVLKKFPDINIGDFSITNQNKKIFKKIDTCVSFINTCKGILETVKNKKKSYEMPLFSENVTSDTTLNSNDSKSLCFEMIIANALEKGKLKERVVYCEKSKDDIFNVIKKIEQNGKIKKISGAAEKDKILRTAISYKLIKDSHQEYAVINKRDISNWCESSNKMEGLKLFLFEDESVNKKLFLEKIYSGNTVKVKVSSEWLEYCGFEIKDADDECIDSKFKCKIIDQGACKELLFEELKQEGEVTCK